MTKIILQTLNGQTLTLDEAQRLYEELHAIFGPPPEHVPLCPNPFISPYPLAPNDYPFAPPITCTTTQSWWRRPSNKELTEKGKLLLG